MVAEIAAIKAELDRLERPQLRPQRVLVIIPLNLDGYLFECWKDGKAQLIKDRLACTSRHKSPEPLAPYRTSIHNQPSPLTACWTSIHQVAKAYSSLLDSIHQVAKAYSSLLDKYPSGG